MKFRKPLRTLKRLKTGEAVTLVALGDSLTYGWMVEKGYLDYLREILNETYPDSNVHINNRGIPGDTAAGGLDRLGSDVVDAMPDCVLIQFALNDAFTGYSPDQFGKNIERMIDTLSFNTEADIILITSVWIGMPSEYRRALAYYRQLESIAAARNLPIAKVHEYWENKIDGGLDVQTLVQADGVHPTSTGYKLMAEAIGEVFAIEEI